MRSAHRSLARPLRERTARASGSSGSRSGAHRGSWQAGAVEIPWIALLVLGGFLWIFATNTLPARRELAQRRELLQELDGEDGSLVRLRAELGRTERLSRAIEVDPTLRTAFSLLEDPTGPARGAIALPPLERHLSDPEAEATLPWLLPEVGQEPLPGVGLGTAPSASGTAAPPLVPAEAPRTGATRSADPPRSGASRADAANAGGVTDPARNAGSRSPGRQELPPRNPGRQELPPRNPGRQDVPPRRPSAPGSFEVPSFLLQG